VKIGFFFIKGLDGIYFITLADRNCLIAGKTLYNYQQVFLFMGREIKL
jgi:hypothetical protein